MDETAKLALWKKVLGILKPQLSKADFLSLLEKITLISLENNIATIAAPSAMVIDLIHKRFYALLKETICQLANQKLELILVPKIILPDAQDRTDNPLFAETQKPQPKSFGHLPRVRPDFTFQTIAVSSSNQLAFTSATTVAKHLGTSYNPLFIYGPVGVGKTHLMQAIANDVYQKDPTKKIIYITSEEFTNEVVEAIRGNQTQIMKRRFRGASLLIIDDIQFIAGKDRVQEELFHTFNILIDNNSQIVLSSDRPPHEIKKLEQRLSSRFAGGLSVDIEPPDFELKTAILLIKAKKYGYDLPIEIAKNVAQTVTDTRSLEGALLRIITEANASGGEITQELANKAIKNKQAEERNKLHPDDIVKHVCEYYGIKITQLKGPKREASLVKARQVCMFLLKKELNMTFMEIGNLLGGRDHTTIMYGVEKIEDSVENKTKASEDIVGITRVLHG